MSNDLDLPYALLSAVVNQARLDATVKRPDPAVCEHCGQRTARCGRSYLDDVAATLRRDGIEAVWSRILEVAEPQWDETSKAA